MNINDAAHYLKLGYRIRRSNWESEEYIYYLCDLEKVEICIRNRYDKNLKKWVSIREVREALGCFIVLEDLLANDWEIVTLGIRKYFNKYNHMEYNGDLDYDNYVHSKSSGYDNEK